MITRTGVGFVDSLLEKDLTSLITTVVEGERALTRGRQKDLEKHFEQISKEFAGRSELCLLHAMLIVLIRREISLPGALQNFRHLWRYGFGPLCILLDLRWLVSACDTIADHPENEADGVRALLASTLVNTVKLYETERRALRSGVMTPELVVEAGKDKPGLLFDGVTRYDVAGGDMVVNLIERLARANGDRRNGVQFLTVAVINRVLEGPTVFNRFQQWKEHQPKRWSSIPQ